MTHTHFIGIGGTGLSAIARVLLERGETVSGSDRQLSRLAADVQAAGATVYAGHAAAQVAGADVVVRSSAVPEDNVEVLAAQQAGIPVLRRIDYLARLIDGRPTIGVAGSHGKTTTTSMIAWMLSALGQRPSFIVGGTVENLGTNARAGSGRWFVIEADEYDYMFWGLNPKLAVVTNVEHDHPDCFPTPESFTAAFEGYADRLAAGGQLLAYQDDPGSADLLAYANHKGYPTKSYSLKDQTADYWAGGLQAMPGAGYRFTAYKQGQPLAAVSLKVPGRHNVANALAALAAADFIGLNIQEAALALGDFRGAGRRFEELGERRGVLVVDDYGHHPTEIAATLEAAQSRYPDRRIWAVWQPHTFSRTRQLLAEFGQAVSAADQVVVLAVYAAREQQPEDFQPEQILQAIPHPAPSYQADLGGAAEYILENVQSGDVVIVFSAGDATQVSAQVLNTLKAQEQINA